MQSKDKAWNITVFSYMFINTISLIEIQISIQIHPFPVPNAFEGPFAGWHEDFGEGVECVVKEGSPLTVDMRSSTGSQDTGWV